MSHTEPVPSQWSTDRLSVALSHGRVTKKIICANKLEIYKKKSPFRNRNDTAFRLYY